jgi:primosomal protein N' (replication factor Y)
VVDEEHDGGYKNGESPRYHGRDVAATRARLEGARLVLGSATPSLESIARTGRGLILAELSERVRARPMPPVTLVDLKSAPMIPGTGAVPWSELLDQAVSVALAEREQVLLLLNASRSSRPFLQCRACGAVPECPNCSISLTIHRRPDALRCHYCDYRRAGARGLRRVRATRSRSRAAWGPSSWSRLVAERFPRRDWPGWISTRPARDGLTIGSLMRSAGATSTSCLGTQMIAKGIDLPEVTLVGWWTPTSAPPPRLPPPRSGPSSCLTQVAGRAGRGDRGGRVIVQTRQPLHHALVHATSHDVIGFLAEELALRQSPPYPPETSLGERGRFGSRRGAGCPAIDGAGGLVHGDGRARHAWISRFSVRRRVR